MHKLALLAQIFSREVRRLLEGGINPLETMFKGKFKNFHTPQVLGSLMQAN